MQFTPVCDPIFVLRNYYFKELNSLDDRYEKKGLIMLQNTNYLYISTNSYIMICIRKLGSW